MKHVEYINLLESYGFELRAKDENYHRFEFNSKEETVYNEDSVLTIEEKIKIEFDLYDEEFRMRSWITDGETVQSTGNLNLTGWIPTIEELTNILKEEYGLKLKDNKEQ